MRPLVWSRRKTFLARSLAASSILILFTGLASATLTITMISPTTASGGTALGGTPVFFEAYATSPECSSGVASMRIYTDPGVDAYTVAGGHLETFIALPLGSYDATIQAWDNCGAVAKSPLNLQVTSGNISVYLPNSELGFGPVHIAASSQTGCNRGISAMRLYTAPYIGPYTVNSNALDAFVTLPPATYDMTIVAWDKCGGVFTSNFTSVITGAPDGYVYGIYGSGGDVAELQVGDTGNLINPNGSAAPPQVAIAGANSAVVDPGGWFLYASGTKGVYAFEIDPVNGALVPVAGSPFSASGVSQVVMDPSGNYLYALSSSIATYRVNRSNGALTAITPTVKLPPVTTFSVAVDSGFFYVLGINPSGQLWGYSLNDTTGVLMPIAGLPITVNSGVDAVVAQGYHLYVNDNGNYGGGANAIYAYDINPATGALTTVPGSPFPMVDQQNLDYNFVSLWGDWEDRYLWAWQLDTTDINNSATTLDIGANGSVALTNNSILGGAVGFANFTEDLTGNYVFCQWTNEIQPPSPNGKPPQGPDNVGVQSLYISDGQLVPDSSTILPNTFAVQAVARGNPN
jgi:hypothetical protein